MHIEVGSKDQAFRTANGLVHSDYEYDADRSERAGYPIYYSTILPDEWISDLGDRLEVNLSGGKTINIWIDAREKLEKSGFRKTDLGIWVLA